MKAHFDHERLKVYQVACELNREIGTILEEIREAMRTPGIS